MVSASPEILKSRQGSFGKAVPELNLSLQPDGKVLWSVFLQDDLGRWSMFLQDDLRLWSVFLQDDLRLSPVPLKAQAARGASWFSMASAPEAAEPGSVLMGFKGCSVFLKSLSNRASTDLSHS